MKGASILDTDLSTAGRMLAAGVRWWTGELAAMLPKRLANLFSRQPSTMILPDEDGVWRAFRDGRPLDLSGSTRKPHRVMLGLEPQQVLVRDVAVPPLALSDTRRMIGYDIDRLTPFRHDDVFVDIELPRCSGEGAHHAVLAVAPRAAVLSAVASARAQGFDPVMIVVAQEDGARFDFAPTLAESSSELGRRRSGGWLRVAVAGLAIANIAMLVYRDARKTDALRELVAGQGAQAAAVVRLRAAVRAEDERRAALIDAGPLDSPLVLLDRLSETLPDGAWVQRFSAGQQRVRLVGYRRADTDVRVALQRTPGLSNVRNADADIEPASEEAIGFDIIADRRRPNR